MLIDPSHAREPYRSYTEVLAGVHLNPRLSVPAGQLQHRGL